MHGGFFRVDDTSALVVVPPTLTAEDALHASGPLAAGVHAAATLLAAAKSATAELLAAGSVSGGGGGSTTSAGHSRAAAPRPPCVVAVVGCGAEGLATVAALRHKLAKLEGKQERGGGERGTRGDDAASSSSSRPNVVIVAADPSERRRAQARELGADNAVAPSEIAQLAASISGGVGCVGVVHNYATPLRTSARLLAPGGELLC